MSTPFVIIDEICRWWDAKMDDSLPESTPSVDHKLLKWALSMVKNKAARPLIKEFIGKVARMRASGISGEGSEIARAFLEMLVSFKGETECLKEYVRADITKSCAFKDMTFRVHDIFFWSPEDYGLSVVLDTISGANLKVNKYGITQVGEYRDPVLHLVREFVSREIDGGELHHDLMYHGRNVPDLVHDSVTCDVLTKRMYENMNRYAYSVLHMSASVFYAFIVGHAGYDPWDKKSDGLINVCLDGKGKPHEVPDYLRVLSNDPDFQMGTNTPVALARYILRVKEVGYARIPSMIAGKPGIDLYGHGTFFWFVPLNGKFVYTVDLADPEMGNDDLGSTIYENMSVMMENLGKIGSD